MGRSGCRSRFACHEHREREQGNRRLRSAVREVHQLQERAHALGLSEHERGWVPTGLPGGMAEYMVLEGQYVHPFPDEWSFDEGAWIENFSVGYFGIWGNGGSVDAKDKVIITGGGPIGLSALAVAKAAQAYVIIVEPLPARQKLAREYGADVVVNPNDPDFVQQILDLTHGGGDLIVEASGNDKAIASVFDIAGHSARVRLIGHSIGRKIPIEIGKTIWRTLNITGAGGTKNFMPRSIAFMDRIRKTHNFSKAHHAQVRLQGHSGSVHKGV